MNLVGYTATALSSNDITDTPKDKNVVSGAIVELKTLQGDLVTIYDDSSGVNPETQKACDSDGQCTFYAETGDYNLEINGNPQKINLFFNKDKVNDIAAWGGRFVGYFADGFTYTKADDVAKGIDGKYYRYSGASAYPVVVAAGAVPIQPEYTAVFLSDAESVKNTDGSSAQDTHDVLKATLIAQGLSGEFGFFASGFTYNNEGDVGVTVDNQLWAYKGSLPFNVPAGTAPSPPDYAQVTSSSFKFSSANQMKAFTDIARFHGKTVSVSGYYEGWADLSYSTSCEYNIKTLAEATSDGDIIDEYGSHTLQNGYVAVLLYDQDKGALQFGVRKDVLDYQHLELQALFDFCEVTENTIYLPSGDYYVDSPLNYSISVGSDWGERPHIKGDGRGNTRIIVNNDINAINILGGTGVDAHSYLVMEGIRVYKAGATGLTNNGIFLDNIAFALLRDVGAERFEYGIFGQDLLSSDFTKVKCLGNEVGFLAQKGDFSHPNALTFTSCVFTGNKTWGLQIQNPSTITMIGGSVEGNALGKLPTDTCGGMLILSAGREGSMSINIQGTYFEYNTGIADIFHSSSGTDGKVSMNVAASFNRISDVSYVQNNIKVDGDVKMAMTLASGFKSFNTYVPDAARPCVSIPSGSPQNYKIADTSFYSDSVDAFKWEDAGRMLSVDTAALAYGVYDMATSTLISGVNVESVTKNGTGDISIVCKEKPASGSNSTVLVTTDTVGFVTSPNGIVAGVPRVITYAIDGTTPQDMKVKFAIFEESNYF